jgi:hypothetical protein
MPGSPKPDTVLAELFRTEAPLCLHCMLAKSRLPIGDVMATLLRLAQTLSVKRDPAGYCRACGHWTLVYSLFENPVGSWTASLHDAQHWRSRRRWWSRRRW